MIGLCTPYKINNYGTKLQAYAVQEKIKSLGYEVEIINFERKSDLRPSRLVRRYFNKAFILKKLQKKFGSGEMDKLLSSNLKIRKDAINSFDQSHYVTTPLIKGFSALRDKSKNYDAVVCGSDQIWLPTSIHNPTSTLEFAVAGCRRIAFAPSFGISQVPKKQKKLYQSFLKQLDAISVRETNGVTIVKELAGVDASVVLDPTLSVDPAIWTKLAQDGKNPVKEKYVFCYFLGGTEQHRIDVYHFAKKRGLKIVTLPHFKGYHQADETYTDIQLFDVTPSDFIRIIAEAEVVCTDSFHATVFSILNHREFYTFERFSNNDANSANSRIYSLLGQLGLEGQIVNSNDYDFERNRQINFAAVERKLYKLRRETDDYLHKAFSGIQPDRKSVEGFSLPNGELCTGCGACASVCPPKCISIETNENGFRMPVFDSQNCINCRLCEKVCPQKQFRNLTHCASNPRFVQCCDDLIRYQSSSGGLFYPLAKKIIEESGFVCGAAYSKDYRVEHRIVDNADDLFQLVGSKYAESDLKDCYVQIKALLDAGKKVMFCGTPCQAHGLHRYLRKSYPNLFIMDLLCYGIQSTVAWGRYLEEIVPKGAAIIHLDMRSKVDSWQKYSMEIAFSDGSKYIGAKDKDPYLRSYSKGIFIRPSCYACQLKAFPRVSDITVGDFWDIDKVRPEKNDGKGAGLIFVNSSAGSDMIDELEKSGALTVETINENELRKVHPLFCVNAKKSRKSKKFFELLKRPDTSFSYAVKVCERSKFEILFRKIYKKIR